jgi:hypothetical protein
MRWRTIDRLVSQRRAAFVGEARNQCLTVRRKESKGILVGTQIARKNVHNLVGGEVPNLNRLGNVLG